MTKKHTLTATLVLSVFALLGSASGGPWDDSPAFFVALLLNPFAWGAAYFFYKWSKQTSTQHPGETAAKEVGVDRVVYIWRLKEYEEYPDHLCYKVGVTSEHLAFQRIKAVSDASGFSIADPRLFTVENPFAVESRLKQIGKQAPLPKFDGYTECRLFTLDEYRTALQLCQEASESYSQRKNYQRKNEKKTSGISVFLSALSRPYALFVLLGVVVWLSSSGGPGTEKQSEGLGTEKQKEQLEKFSSQGPDTKQQLEKFGARVLSYKGKSDIFSVNFNRTQVTDVELGHLKELTSLKKLYLSDTTVTDVGMGHLKGLTSLKELYLNDT